MSPLAVLLMSCSPGTVFSASLAEGLVLPPNNHTLPGPDQHLITAPRATSCLQGLGSCREPPALHTRLPEPTRAWVRNLSLSHALVHIHVSSVPPGPPESLLQDCVPLPNAGGHDGTRPGEGQVGLVPGARRRLCHGRSYSPPALPASVTGRPWQQSPRNVNSTLLTIF